MMNDMADHRRAPQKSSAKGPAWGVLVTMGGTSVTLNIWDATHGAHLFWLIAGLRGFAPVLAAMFLSEVGARFDGGKTFRWVAFSIMAGAMVLSASAVANVLRPSYPAGVLGLVLSWMFGLVLDAAALAGLWVILTERERKRVAERLAAEHDAGQELAEAVAAAEDRVRGELDAEAARLHEAHATELERLRTELAAANATAEALRTAARGRKPRRSSARKPVAATARNLPGTTAPEPASTSGAEATKVPAGTTGPAGELDMDQEARLLILDYVAKGHSASEAGRLAGKTDGYGRQVVRLAKAAKQEPAAGERTEGDMA